MSSTSHQGGVATIAYLRVSTDDQTTENQSKR